MSFQILINCHIIEGKFYSEYILIVILYHYIIKGLLYIVDWCFRLAKNDRKTRRTLSNWNGLKLEIRIQGEKSEHDDLL